MESGSQDFGRVIKQQRQVAPLTLLELGGMCVVSASHLGRIERGERFPSAQVLRKIAKPLGFEVEELFTLAGFLTPQDAAVAERRTAYVISPWSRPRRSQSNGEGTSRGIASRARHTSDVKGRSKIPKPRTVTVGCPT